MNGMCVSIPRGTHSAPQRCVEQRWLPPRCRAVPKFSARPPAEQDSLAEWSKALASGASPQGRGFEPHSCHLSARSPVRAESLQCSPVPWCAVWYRVVSGRVRRAP